MANSSLLSLRGLSGVLGTVGLASLAVALLHRALKPSSRPAMRDRVARLRTAPTSLRDGHLGATEKAFDWVGAGPA